MSTVIQEVKPEDIPVYRDHKEVVDKVAEDIIQLVKASLAKAILHKAEPTKFPISQDPKSEERISLELLGRIKNEKQAVALNKTRALIANETERKKHFGEYAEAQVLANPNGIAEVWRGRAANKPPIAYPQTVHTKVNQEVHIVLTGHDPEGGSLTFQMVSSTSHGELKVVGGMVGIKDYLYHPKAGYTGNDSFTFTAKDKAGKVSAPAVVHINIVSIPTPQTPPQKQTVKLVIENLQCVEATSGLGNDDITCAVFAIDDGGRQHFWKSADEMQMDDGDVANFGVQIGLSAKEPEKDANGRIISQGWPKYYTMIVALAEIDWGGFADYLNNLWNAVDDKVKALIIAGVATAIGGSIGGVIGAAAGAIIGGLIGIILQLVQDDIFKTETHVFKLNHSNPVTSPDWTSSPINFWWKQFGGHYIFNFKWMYVN
jgi:hypothetical protein